MKLKLVAKMQTSSTKKSHSGYIKYPDSDWKAIEVGDYEDLQKLIGGYFQLVPIDDSLTLYCDEEGKIKDLYPNVTWVEKGKIIDVLVGPLVLFGPVDDEGEHTDATEETIKLLEKHCV